MGLPRRQASIARRLFIANLCILPLLLVLTGAAINRAHTSSLTQAEHERLKLHFFSLLGAMEWQQDSVNMGDRLKEPKFWQFRSGLYANITTPKREIIWQSLSAESLSLAKNLTMPKSGEAILSDTVFDSEPYFYYRYHAIWELEDQRELPLVFTIYSSKSLFTQEQQKFQKQLLLWLGIVLILTLLFSILLLYWGLRPLRLLTQDVSQLESGKAEQLTGQYPRELQSITHNLNQLLKKESKQRDRYRNTLADLAHSLKTPLAVLQTQRQSSSSQEQLSRMENIINYQLNRAVNSSASGIRLNSSCNIAPRAERLVATLEKVYASKGISFEVSIDNNLTLPIDEQDAMELLGNLLDNAAKACRRRVNISSHNADSEQYIYIDDDGAGISNTQKEALLQRGTRGDQYSAGQGLGLAIARDILHS
ncbi:MAG: ATP-binding protein, partial [Spongiibacteraceae bacterium]